MKPTKGRIVWYTPRVQVRGERKDDFKAALIVDVDEAQGLGPGSREENSVGVYLAVFDRAVLTFPGAPVRWHAEGAPGTWRWPDREPRPEQAPLLPSS